MVTHQKYLSGKKQHQLRPCLFLFKSSSETQKHPIFPCFQTLHPWLAPLIFDFTWAARLGNNMIFFGDHSIMFFQRRTASGRVLDQKLLLKEHTNKLPEICMEMDHAPLDGHCPLRTGGEIHLHYIPLLFQGVQQLELRGILTTATQHLHILGQ